MSESRDTLSMSQSPAETAPNTRTSDERWARWQEKGTSIEAALQVVEKFASRLTVGDAEGHVRRSVDELCAAVTKKEGIEPAVDRLVRGIRGLDDARAARRRRDFGRESPAVDRLLDAVQEQLLPPLRCVGYQV